MTTRDWAQWNCGEKLARSEDIDKNLKSGGHTPITVDYAITPWLAKSSAQSV